MSGNGQSSLDPYTIAYDYDRTDRGITYTYSRVRWEMATTGEFGWRLGRRLSRVKLRNTKTWHRQTRLEYHTEYNNIFKLHFDYIYKTKQEWQKKKKKRKTLSTTAEDKYDEIGTTIDISMGTTVTSFLMYYASHVFRYWTTVTLSYQCVIDNGTIVRYQHNVSLQNLVWKINIVFPAIRIVLQLFSNRFHQWTLWIEFTNVLQPTAMDADEWVYFQNAFWIWTVVNLVYPHVYAKQIDPILRSVLFQQQ